MSVTFSLPQGWTETTFGEVVSNVSINEKKLPKGQYSESGKFPVVDQGQQFIGGYTDDERKVVSEDLPLLVFGDHTRAFKFLNQPFVPGADGVKVLKPQGVDPKWLFQMAHVLEFPDKGYARHFQHLKSAKLFVPPLSEQRRIVAEIEKQFTRLEAGVAALRRVQANLKRYRAAILKTACEGDWQRKPLGELLQNGRSMGYGVLKPGPHVPDGVRLLKSGQVRDGTLDLTEDYRISNELDAEFKRTRLQGGELLLNLVGASIGRSAIATAELKGANVSRAIAVIPVVPERTKWVQIVLSSPDSQSGILGRRTGIAQPVLNLGQVKQLPIPLPPLAEQRRIVAEVERRLSVVEELESVVSANLQRATRLRQSILQKAFTGELVS